MITVVIPNYKRVESLLRSLNSVFDQNYSDCIEIIVVDDNSPNYHEIKISVEKLVPPSHISIVLLKHELNRNASAARNTGILYARGEYIALLDSDDCWEPNYLNNQLSFYHKVNNEEIVVFGICINKIKEGEWIRPSRGLKDYESLDEYIFLHQECCQTSTLFSSVDTFKKNLFDESIKAFQDPSFAINAVNNGCRMLFNHDAIVNRYLDWTRDNDHVGNKIDKKFLLFWLEKHRGRMTELGVDAFSVRYFKKNRIKIIIKYLFKSNFFSIFKIILRESLKSNLSFIYNSNVIKKIRIIFK